MTDEIKAWLTSDEAREIAARGARGDDPIRASLRALADALPSSPSPTGDREREALLKVERAAREVDDLFTASDWEGEDVWSLDGKKVPPAAEAALVALYGRLGELDDARAAAPSSPSPVGQEDGPGPYHFLVAWLQTSGPTVQAAEVLDRLETCGADVDPSSPSVTREEWRVVDKRGEHVIPLAASAKAGVCAADRSWPATAPHRAQHRTVTVTESDWVDVPAPEGSAT